MNRDSSVSIVTRLRLENPGSIFDKSNDFSLRPSSLLSSGYRRLFTGEGG
jgi:hypothetical protein